MKKILLSGLLLTALCFQSQAKVIIKKSNGGLHGYKYISETHGWLNDRLNCTDPGESHCMWITAPLVKGLEGEVSSEKIEDWVNSKISEGYYLGDSQEFEGTGIHVTWIYNEESGDLDIEITDSNGQ